MVIVSGTDPLRDEAMKNHEENEKAYEEAMKENKEAIDLVSGDETKKKDGKIKSSELKKMHLSESLFEDYGFDDFEEKNSEEDDSTENPFMKDEKAWGKINKYLDEDANNRSDWHKVYSIFNSIISLYFPDATAIENNVYDIYKSHKGEAAWDEAWSRWVDDPETDGLHENFFHEAQHLEEDALDDVGVSNSFVKVLAETAPDKKFKFKDTGHVLYGRDLLDYFDPWVKLKNVELSKDTFLVIDRLDENFFYESQHLEEDAGDDFLDKINKQILNVNEDLELNEEKDVKSAYDIANDIIEEYPKDVDIYNHTPTGSTDDYYKIEFLVDGDWKHDHLAFKYWMNNNAAEISGCEVKYGGETPIEESDDDVYKAVHTYFFIPEKQEIQEPEIEEPQQEEEENMEEIGFDDDSIVAESLKFQIAKEQLKRFNEGKMPKDWSPNKYLENLVKRNHLTEEQKNVLTEAFLK